MGSPNGETLAVRITVVGHASRRWRGAHSASEAAAANLRLSEVRARTIHREVEAIVKRELPSLPIETSQKGVGSSDPFPTAGEDNAGIDRSVVVMVDLVWTIPTYKAVPRPPYNVYAPSTFWTLKITALTGASGLGARASLMRIKIRNPFTRRELIMSGPIFGGDLDIGAGLFAKNPKADPFKLDPREIKQLHDGAVGNEVTFQTQEMDFSGWVLGGGRSVRLLHGHIKTGVTKSQTSFLQFTDVDTHPGSLVFDLKALGFSFGIPDVDIHVQAGRLTPENSPSDYVLATVSPDIVPTQSVGRHKEGFLLSFPTGRSGIGDLTPSQMRDLREFVIQRARGIRALAETMQVVAPTP
ncbi:MAG: hypothetical protein AB1586_21415 [Pseudomonadota bacterium]